MTTDTLERHGTRWDEPAGAATPRGWFHVRGTCTGFYLDYGPEHYRSPHAYCSPRNLCRTCQPGNVLAVRYPTGPAGQARASRYCETIEDARVWIETGR